MEGKVVQFRLGEKTYHKRHFILDVSAKTKKDAEKFIGRIVVWKSSAGKEISGEIRATHGNKGLVRAIFEKGLPGQAVNEKVLILGRDII